MNRKKSISILITVILFGPLFIAVCAGFADGIVRSRNAPIQSIVGQKIFSQWIEGMPSQKHYWGSDRKAPDFELLNHLGQPWKLSDHRGKKIILNFWTITCQPCLEELPSLEQLAKTAKEKDQKIEVVGICTDENWEKVKHLFQNQSGNASSVKASPNMTILFDPEKKVVLEKFGTELFPETWVVDENGIIRFRYDGALDWSSALVRDLIDSL